MNSVSCYCFCIQLFMLFVTGVWRLSFLLLILYLASPVINSSKHCIYLNIIQQFSSSLRVNIAFLQYNEASVNVV